MSQVTKHAELVEYTHKGVSVFVKIDYDGGIVTLAEAQKNSLPTVYTAKQWVFAGRGLEYMAGWQNIFDAMKHAVKEATRELRIHEEAKDKERTIKDARIVDGVIRDIVRKKK